MDIPSQQNPTGEEALEGVRSQERIQTTVRALRALLEGDEEEQRETFAYLKQALDEDRFSTRRLFP
ncbi:MAG TPA: hypothetical protein VGX03_09650 [Candidatus Binatia bacterium]|jgi:hypothetical protein|nr:hypothetical protein [Candidatus Binatia bacterium]